MTEERPLYNSVAPLRNVAALVALVDRVQNRAQGLPGMACYYGPSGFGKSTAAIYAENKSRAYQVQVKSAWTARKFCEAVLGEMALRPARTIADMVDQISEHLAITAVPLLIDEADHLVARRMIEIVRDIYEGSQAAVVLIGEELLPQKLLQWERVHGRMLDWVAAEPATLDDVDKLRPIYAPGLQIARPLADAILKHSGRSIRRISINLARISELAQMSGRDQMVLADFDTRQFFTGTAPTPRRNVA
ncbi:MAG: AAA family ATPase [Roseinatronobacter sp.]